VAKIDLKINTYKILAILDTFTCIMSYHNQSIYILDLQITATYIRQHIVLVDLLTHNEFKRNGWSPHTVPFYPSITNNQMMNYEQNEKTQKDKGSQSNKSNSINESTVQ